jgi:hypothetical protein
MERTGIDVCLEAAILQLLEERGAGKTICPSEVARAVAPSADRKAWMPLIEPVRAAARRLVTAGKIVITQRGVVVEDARVRGPIRLRRA